mgnify:CR=1 FL=1
MLFRSYSSDQEGHIVDTFYAEKIAVMAYIEGMEAYNNLLKQWSQSDEIDPKKLDGLVAKHLEELNKSLNIDNDGREFSTDSSL